MTQVFTEEGRAVPVTVIKAGPCRVVQVKTPDTDGYAAVQLSLGQARRAGKPLAGHYGKAGVEPARHLVELRTGDASSYQNGQEIKADVFQPGQHVDVVGVSKGHGFSGPMKRHGFGGLPASPRAARKHPDPRAVGAAATPSPGVKGV